MTEIEFLDPGHGSGSAGAESERPDDEPGGPDLRALVPGLAAAVAWVLAAGLAVMASVSNVYELVVDSGSQRQTITVDAWGRFNTGVLNQSIGHQTRYAVVLIAAAVLLLAAALVAVVRLPISRYLAVAGAAVTAAIATTLVLFVEATRSTNDVEARQLASGASVRTDLGSAFWLALGATAAAVVGIVLAFVLKPAAEPAAEPAADGAGEPAGEPARQAEDVPARSYPAEAVEAAEPVSGGGGVAAG